MMSWLLLGRQILCQVCILQRLQIAHLLGRHLIVGSGQEFAILELLLQLGTRPDPFGALLSSRKNLHGVR